MSNDYERVRIIGTLTCLSPLSVGIGAMPAAVEGKEGQSGNYLDICAHPDGIPFIPGSSLRGLLAALLDKGPDDKNRGPHYEEHIKLFGEARGGKRGENNLSRAGCLRVYDASLSRVGEGGEAKVDRTRTAIDPITATAKDNSLHKIAQVPANSQFQCEFELERVGKTLISRSWVETLLGLLNTLDRDNLQARLGRGGNKSEGRVAWSLDSVNTLSSADLADWLIHAKPSLEACYKDETKKLKHAAIYRGSGQERFWHLSLRLEFLGPLLVDAEEKEEIIDNETRRVACCRYETRDGKTCLTVPAASLRGLLRGHCRKILMTLLVDKLKEDPPYKKAKRHADELIGVLFGQEGKASAVILRDAVGENPVSHRQTFNAIDRFTGGVAHDALYTVEAAYTPYLDTQLSIDLLRLKPQIDQVQNDWWKGLLVLALRDAMEGDMALGWGKAKGYGVFKLAIRWEGLKEYIAEWDQLRKTKGIPNAANWVKALHGELNRRTDA